MKTIEQLQIEQAKQIQILTAEHATANKCPLPPERVMQSNPHNWVSYSAETITAAIAIFKMFPKKVNIEHRKGSCTTITAKHPRYTEQYAHQGDYAAVIDVSEGEKFGPTVRLNFYADLCDEVAKITIEIGGFNSAISRKFKAQINERRNSRTNRLESRTYSANPALNGYSDKVITFASGDIGPIKESANISYLFAADDGEDCSEFTNLLGMLENMAAEFEGAK